MAHEAFISFPWLVAFSHIAQTALKKKLEESILF